MFASVVPLAIPKCFCLQRYSPSDLPTEPSETEALRLFAEPLVLPDSGFTCVTDELAPRSQYATITPKLRSDHFTMQCTLLCLFLLLIVLFKTFPRLQRLIFLFLHGNWKHPTKILYYMSLVLHMKSMCNKVLKSQSCCSSYTLPACYLKISLKNLKIKVSVL